MVGVNHKSHLKRNNIKSASADLGGSTKSCNQVQISSQSNSVQWKGTEQITFLAYVQYKLIFSTF